MLRYGTLSKEGRIDKGTFTIVKAETKPGLGCLMFNVYSIGSLKQTTRMLER